MRKPEPRTAAENRDRRIIMPRPQNRTLLGCLALGAVLATSLPAQAQSLRGSRASMDIQNRIAGDHEFTYLRTPADVRRFVDAGYLVPVRPNRDFDLHAVSFPYARPEVELFIRRLASQYRAGCGEQLVVTSLTRPQNRQPANASDRSVHPTGMAMDLRLSSNGNCRAWLEDVLLSLEDARILEATRERYPPHYHVAVFPTQYRTHVERLTERPARVLTRVASNVAPESIREYVVRSGESLWTIARAHGTTVSRLRSENGLRGSTIRAGQVLRVPVTSN